MGGADGLGMSLGMGLGMGMGAEGEGEGAVVPASAPKAADSSLTHGTEVVFAGNLTRGLRRHRTKDPLDADSDGVPGAGASTSTTGGGSGGGGGGSSGGVASYSLHTSGGEESQMAALR